MLQPAAASANTNAATVEPSDAIKASAKAFEALFVAEMLSHAGLDASKGRIWRR